MRNSDNLILRIGQIGDILTAVETAKSLNCDLAVSASKLDLLFGKSAHSYSKILEAIIGSTGFPIKVFDLALFRKGHAFSQYKAVFLLAQSTNMKTHMFSFLLTLLTGKKVSILDEGSQWLYSFVYSNTLKVKKKISDDVSGSGDLSDAFNVVVVWNGKECEKNLSSETLDHISSVIGQRIPHSSIRLVGGLLDYSNDSVINLTGKTTLKEAFDLIDECQLLVSVDTGLLHYGAIRGKSVIAFIARRYPLAVWFPLKDNVGLSSRFPMAEVNSDDARAVFSWYFDERD